MNIKKYISYGFLLAATALSSCSSEEFTDTIFPDGTDTLDPTSSTYKFDKWLRQTYTDEYNLDFRYKMQDVGADMNYNLVPAEYDKAIDLALLTKYLWFDAYKAVVGKEFLQEYGPRIIHLIGSAAKNPTTGTEILGLAEGGIKVSLFKVNELDNSDFNNLNEYYFKTMHHEFTHILHQTKSYPTDFNLQSNGHYDDNNWQNKDSRMINSLGFVTPYASSQYREDVAETVANYIVKTDAQWNAFLDNADRGWETDDLGDDGEASSSAKYYCFYYFNNNETGDANKKYLDESVVDTTEEDGKTVYYHKTMKDTSGNRIKVFAVEDKDGVVGRTVILAKLNILRIWLKDSFGIDIDAIRAEVQKRQLDYDINDLRKVVNEME